jgi:hypothetical protein
VARGEDLVLGPPVVQQLLGIHGSGNDLAPLRIPDGHNQPR